MAACKHNENRTKDLRTSTLILSLTHCRAATARWRVRRRLSPKRRHRDWDDLNRSHPLYGNVGSTQPRDSGRLTAAGCAGTAASNWDQIEASCHRGEVIGVLGFSVFGATLSWIVAFRNGLIRAMMPFRLEFKTVFPAKTGWNTSAVVGRSAAHVLPAT